MELVVANLVFGAVSFVLNVSFAVLLTSPTMATIALTLTIPGPLFIDTMIHGFDVSSVYRIAGGVCVIVGFVFVTLRRAN